jgi:transposase
MVKKKMYKRIQKLKRQGYGKSKIAEKLDMDPATIRKYFPMTPSEYNHYQFGLLERKKAFKDFEQEILAVYEANDNKKLNMAAVYDYLEERYDTLPGNEQTLRNYIRSLLNTGKITFSTVNRCYITVPPLPYGKQLQIDFGTYTTKSGLTLYIFGAVLSASRYKYIALQDNPFTTLDLIDHLLDCFDYIGGLPEELVIDQDSIMVVSENYGDIIYTEKFSFFIQEMGLKMYVCRKADPQSKGKIENVIKYVKYNFLHIRDFTCLKAAQESLLKWLLRRGNGKISQATKRIPKLAIEEERRHLRPLKNSIFRKYSLLGREERIVSDKGYITVGAVEYSVPEEYRNRQIEIFATETELFVFNRKTGAEITMHKISHVTGKKVIKREHFRAKSMRLKELQKQILDLHEFTLWKEYVGLNMKAYPRYSRDQLLYAKNHLKDVEDVSILEMSVAYCIENKTYSMKQLKDTYEYQLREHKEDQNIIRTLFQGLTEKPTYQSPEVSSRSVEEYERLVKSAGGGER